MSTINVNNIDKESGSTLTIGGSGTTVNVSNMVPDVALSNRNLIINGGFDIWQRSNDSGVGMPSSWGYYTADRVRTSVSSASGSQRIYKKTNDSTFKNVMAVVGDGSSAYTVEWYIEESARLIDKKVTTFSFYAKVSSGTFNLNSQSHGAYASGIGYTNATTTLNTNWQRIVITVDLTNSTYTGANEMEFRMINSGVIPNGVELHFAQAQLEAGSVATPFENESFGQTLAKCQRYYTKSYDYEDPPGTNTETGAVYFRGSSADSVSNRTVNVSFPVDMRTNPTCTAYSISGTSGAISDCGVAYSEVSAITGSSINGTTGKRGFSRVISGTPVDNMIGLHFVADAEL